MADFYQSSLPLSLGEAALSVARQKGQSESNQIRTEDLPVHDWYRFVLSYPPHLVRSYLERFRVTARQRVLDPFCGTGTTLVECKKNRIKSVGIEANPISHLASQVKLDWGIDPDHLREHARGVARLARRRLGPGFDFDRSSLSLLRSADDNGNGSDPGCRGLPQESAALLLEGSISPRPLHKTIVLSEAILDSLDGYLIGHEQLALAKSVVFDCSNLHFGPEVGVRRKKRLDAPVIECWLQRVDQIARDIELVHELDGVEADVFLGDSREVTRYVAARSINAVITSPPYPNEKDYTRTTRLESVLLGLLKTKSDLREVKKSLLRSNTRNVYKVDDDDLLVKDHPRIQEISAEIERRRIAMGKTSGFERLYARVTELYFGGMVRHLASLRTRLRSGAYLAYVVGDQASYLRVMIRTGELLADLAKSLGYEVLDIELFRTRLSTATKSQLREEVVILRWPG